MSWYIIFPVDNDDQGDGHRQHIMYIPLGEVVTTGATGGLTSSPRLITMARAMATAVTAATSRTGPIHMHVLPISKIVPIHILFFQITPIHILFE